MNLHRAFRTHDDLAATLERQAELSEAKARLLALQARLEPEQAEALNEQAKQELRDHAVASLAANALREAVRLNRETHVMLTGRLPEPERPRLRLVGGGPV